MRFWNQILASVVLAVVSAGAALAQDDDLPALRGGFDPDVAAPGEPLVIEAPTAFTSGDDGSAEEDAGPVRPVQKEPPVAGAEPDDSLTGAIGPNRPKKAPEEDPYAPVGIRAGSFLLYPSLGVTGGYTTNASGTASGTGSGSVTVTPELDIQSDWARHALSLTLRGSYLDYFEDAFDSEPMAEASAKGRIDLPEDWKAELGAGYTYQRQSISDEDFPAGVDEAPGVHDLIATAAVSGDIGRVALTAAAGVERTIYENGRAGTAIVDQGYRTNNLYTARLRLGYEVSPVLTPFVEGEFGLRLYDRDADPFGIERSGHGETVRAGVEIDALPQLKGEIAVGVHRETFDDASLATLKALTVDGSLAWAPTPLTTVTFNAKTTMNPTTDPASSGSILYDGSIDLAYQWRRNFSIDWTAGMSQENFQGIGLEDRTYRLGIGTTWKLNRALQLTSGYMHKWLDSSDESRNYESDAVSVGLRVQR